MNILTLENISYMYHGSNKKVINNISLDFSPGKLYCIMGKSGSGKTTLLSLMSGLDLPTDGNILWNNKNLKDINRDEYRSNCIGVIFQGYNLLLNATAVENIVLSMNISRNKEKFKKAFAFEILNKVGLDSEKALRKILKLSGGEQQRVGIARALSNNPKIIIADEPTGNLDCQTQREILNILQNLAHNENKCVIVVTHSKEVSQVADEIIEINSGTLTFKKKK